MYLKNFILLLTLINFLNANMFEEISNKIEQRKVIEKEFQQKNINMQIIYKNNDLINPTEVSKLKFIKNIDNTFLSDRIKFPISIYLSFDELEKIEKIRLKNNDKFTLTTINKLLNNFLDKNIDLNKAKKEHYNNTWYLEDYDKINKYKEKRYNQYKELKYLFFLEDDYHTNLFRNNLILPKYLSFAQIVFECKKNNKKKSCKYMPIQYKNNKKLFIKQISLFENILNNIDKSEPIYNKIKKYVNYRINLANKDIKNMDYILNTAKEWTKYTSQEIDLDYRYDKYLFYVKGYIDYNTAYKLKLYMDKTKEFQYFKAINNILNKSL